MLTRSPALLVSLVLVSLSLITGCSASTTSRPTMSATASAAMDASWCPPEMVDIAIAEGGAHEGARRDADGQGSYRPNRQPIPQSGAVHAAVY